MTPLPKPRPGQLSEYQKMREETRFDLPRIQGFAPYPKAAAADNWRLTSLSGTRVLDLIIIKALGRRVLKEEPFLEVTEPLKVSQIAELCRLDERTIQRELKDMVDRKVILQTQVGKGLYEFQPLFRDWEYLPDYVPRPLAEPDSESDDEPIEDDPAQNGKDETVTKLTERPVRIAAGKKSKPVKVECGVSALQFFANIDAECSAVVKGGVLLVNLNYAEGSKSGNGRSNVSNNLNSFPRRTSRDDSSKARGKGTKSERRSEGENVTKLLHPRASELCELFDPLILRWCGKTLSGDKSALLRACKAIGDTPHDVLVHDVVERSERTIKPAHAESICKEIEHNWRRSKTLPPQKKLPTREEIDAIIAREQKELAEARRKRRLA